MTPKFLLQVASQYLVRCKPAMNNRFPSWYNEMRERKEKGYHQAPFNLQENSNVKSPLAHLPNTLPPQSNPPSMSN